MLINRLRSSNKDMSSVQGKSVCWLLDPQRQISLKLNQTTRSFTKENKIENTIWKLTFILPRPQCCEVDPHLIEALWGFGYHWLGYERPSPLGLIANYRKTSSISRTNSQNLNVSRLVLQLSDPYPLKPGVKSTMKIYLEQRRQAMVQLHLSNQQFYCILRCDSY